MNATIDSIHQLIRQYNNFILTTHVNPDGDGLGCELALKHFLKKLGKTTSIINHSKTPEHYLWLDENNDIIHFVQDRDKDKILCADVIFIIDTNQPGRLRSMEQLIIQSKALKVVIDHHLDIHPFAQYYLLDEESTSCGEIVYKLLKFIDENLFDTYIATALYTAIMTDTGSFRYPRTDSDTHKIVAHLIECGADPVRIYSNVYENWFPRRMKLLGMMLGTLQTFYDGRLAVVYCTKEMFEQTGATEIETDDFTSFPMSIKNVVISVLINELPDGVKISFRSKGKIPINEFAKEFDGNGHLNAAGARLYNVKLTDIIPTIIEKAKKYL